MKDSKNTPNPAGRTGKPIVLPPSTFEDAVKKMLNTPVPPRQEQPKKKSSPSKKQKDRK